MSVKDIAYRQNARSKILTGVNMLADAVKVTLGPARSQRPHRASWGAPVVTKDGVTVAKEIELGPKLENMGAQMVLEVASRTSDKAGDGTTTATVLAQAIYTEGLKLVEAGHNPMDLKRGIDVAVDKIIAELKALAKPTRDKKEIAQVGTISANGDTHDRRHLGRGHGEGRQGRRHHGRREPGHRHHPRGGRGHAVRPRLPLAVLRHRSREDGSSSSTTRTSSSTRRRSRRITDLLPILEQIAKDEPAAPHRRRGRRRRGARDAGRQQDARHAQGLRREGSRLRRSPQGDAEGHRSAHRRASAIMEDIGIKLDSLTLKDLGLREARHSSTKRTPPSSTAAVAKKTSRAASRRSAARSRPPTATTTKRSSKSASPRSRAASRS